MRAAARDDAEFRKGRRAREALVGIDIDYSGMIDGQEAHLIEIDGLLHRLHEAETQEATAGADAAAGDLQIFVGVSDVALAGADPVAHDTGADHVSDEFVLATVPNEEDRTGAAAAVELVDGLRFARGELDFVLRDAGGPEETQDVHFAFSAEAGENGRGVLAQVAGGALDLPLLIKRPGVEFDFRADGALVVGESLEVDAHPVAGVAAFVAEDERRRAELSDDKISAAAAGEVGDRHGTRLLEFHGVEADVFRHVGPACG